MTKTIILALGLLMVVGANSIFGGKNTKDSGVFTQLQEIDGSDFGKKVLDTIALQLKSKSPLGDISKLLSGILSELNDQQRKSDKAESDGKTECEKTIEGYEARIARATSEIHEAIVQKANYQRQIDEADTQINTFNLQIKVLNEREVAFREARKADEVEFAKRIKQQKAVIEALKKIIPELEHLKPHGNVQQALIELAKIGRSNPIGALLQVALTLDPGALARVIQLLKKLKKSVHASMEDDIKAEEEAKKNYAKMLAEFADEKTNLQTSLAQAKTDRETAKNNFDAQDQRLKTNQKTLAISQKGKKQKQEQCDARVAAYNKEKADRQKEINIVQDILKIISSRLDTVQGYIKERVNK